ncbi:TRAP transporter small permease [Bacillus badius]|uniref:TRAP transporter small permease n=1 Tax=Bacillus badius TaxID=1455 RepID=UPI001CBF912F|nr:TRAP transporter small permease [Bacillus badius]UAT31531.1 TRAP transporter small permease [Bacillus badius]
MIRKSIRDAKIEEWLLVASLLLIIILVFTQVVFRYLISSSLGWSEELSRYVLIWIAWISAAYSVRTQKHIRVELIKNICNEPLRKIIELIALILWFFFALFLVANGTQLILNIHGTGQVSPSNGIPMWIVYLAVPIGGSMMALRLIQQAVYIFKPHLHEEEAEN